MIEKLTDVIAERTFVLTARGTKTKVVIRVARPVLLDDGPDYRCDSEIQIGRKRYRQWTAGVDSVQALELAFCMVTANLRAIRGTLTFLGADKLGLEPFELWIADSSKTKAKKAGAKKKRR